MSSMSNLLSVLQIHGTGLADRYLQLLPGEVVAIDHGKGRKIACTSGVLWVTLEHEGDDIILEPQQTLDIDENGRVVIEALGNSGFKVA